LEHVKGNAKRESQGKEGKTGILRQSSEWIDNESFANKQYEKVKNQAHNEPVAVLRLHFFFTGPDFAGA
jgi:hypothetical protein